MSGRDQLLLVLQRVCAAEVAARCRVHRSSVSRWQTGEHVPADMHQRILRAAFAVSAPWKTRVKRRKRQQRSPFAKT